jgi:hypothetical protein
VAIENGSAKAVFQVLQGSWHEVFSRKSRQRIHHDY